MTRKVNVHLLLLTQTEEEGREEGCGHGGGKCRRVGESSDSGADREPRATHVEGSKGGFELGGQCTGTTGEEKGKSAPRTAALGADGDASDGNDDGDCW